MDIQDCATLVVRRLVDAGYTTYFAGGWVRDHLLGEPRSDIDIATAAPPEVVMELFPHTVAVGVQFGVVIVVEGGHPFEVSSFRRDGLYVDGRRPEGVEYSTPEEDASRRDFTINGMFFDPLTEKVYDFIGGQRDLKKGVVRAIGNAHDRFVEDRLRMVRAVRIGCRFRFSMDPDIEKAVVDNASTLFPAVAIERIWQEFHKMFEYPHFDEAVVTLHRLGLLPEIFPALRGVSVEEIERRVSRYRHFPEGASVVLFVMELFPEASLEELQGLCEYLKVSNSDRRAVERAEEGRRLVEADSGDKALSPMEWVRYYAYPEAEVCLQVVAARYDDEAREAFLKDYRERRGRLDSHVRRLESGCPVVTSTMLKEAGIAPGKTMGLLLREAEKIAVEENLEDGEAVLAVLRKNPLWP